MKTYRQLMAEVAQPKSEDELDFKDKHEVEFIDHPESEEEQHTSKKKTGKRLADYDTGDDMSVYEDLGEAVTVEYNRYMRSHGKKPRDTGGKNQWMFTTKEYGEPKDDEILTTPFSTFADAKKAAKKWADKKGAFSVFVMESTEALDPVGKEDDDIDNDGDVDDSDRYLHNRRKVIAANIKEKFNSILEKAKSESQQRLMGMALAYKRGEMDDASDQVKELADRMSEKDLEDFAKTKHKGLPEKIGESTFVAKAAYSKKAGKDKFKLGSKEFPVTIKKDTADKITEAEDVDVKWLVTWKKEQGDKYMDASAFFPTEREARMYKGKLKNTRGVLRNSPQMKKIKQTDADKRSLANESLYENTAMAAIGRKLQQLAPKEKNDVIANAMANLGDHLESYGTTFGARNMKELEKKTGLTASVIQMLMKKAGGTVNEEVELGENTAMAAIGRKLQQLAPKEKNDTIANAMANLGDHLESYGTTFGARNMKELEKKTGLTASVIQMLMKKANSAVTESTSGAQSKVLHNLMLKALGKSRLPKNHQYTSSVATNGDFVVKDGSGRSVGRILKGEFVDPLKEETDLDEISKNTLASYVKKASHDVATKAAATGRYAERSNKEADNRKKTGDMSNYRQGRDDDKAADKFFKQSWKRRAGIAKAVDKLAEEELDEASKAPKMKPDFFKQQRDSTRERNLAMGKTPTGREKKTRTQSSTQKSLASMRREEIELDEANFAATMKKAIAAHDRGDHSRAKYHLDNAKTARYAMKSTEITKNKDLLDKYKELTKVHEGTDLTENFKTGTVKLNDGSSVIVKKQDADLLNQMFTDLNAQNKKQMLKVAMTDKTGFEEILGFAREAL